MYEDKTMVCLALVAEVKWLSELNELLQTISFGSYLLWFLADSRSQYPPRERLCPHLIYFSLALARLMHHSRSEAQNCVCARKIQHKLAATSEGPFQSVLQTATKPRLQAVRSGSWWKQGCRCYSKGCWLPWNHPFLSTWPPGSLHQLGTRGQHFKRGRGCGSKGFLGFRASNISSGCEGRSGR